MNNQSSAYTAIANTILGKIACFDLAVDALRLHQRAIELNDRRWLTQHPLRITQQMILLQYSTFIAVAPIWFDDYLALFKRVAKRVLEAHPHVTKVKFSGSKGKYVDISLETDFMQPYSQGCLTGEYPPGAETLMSGMVGSRAATHMTTQGYSKFFKGKNFTYTYRVLCSRRRTSLAGITARHSAASIGHILPAIIQSIDHDYARVTALQEPLHFIEVFEEYSREVV